MTISLYAISIFLVIISLLPVTKFRWWGIVLFEYLRFQVFVLCLLALAAWTFFQFWTNWWNMIPVATLSLVCVWHLKRILAYLPVTRKEVKKSSGNGKEISCLIANVFQPNEDRQKLKDLILEYQPDIMLLVEVDEEWTQELSSVLNPYQHRVEVPQDNTYGMALYSKFHMLHRKIHYRVEGQTPSIEADIQVGKKVKIKLHGVHPRPPAPGESLTSIQKDKELVLIGREVSPEAPTIVMGDLNDVAWSKTTRLFQKMSGLLDPRKGRKFLSTFHASVPFMRFPLDHVFISKHFTLVELKRLPHIGSDHFPVLLRISFETDNANTAQVLEMDKEDKEEVRGILKEGA